MLESVPDGVGLAFVRSRPEVMEVIAVFFEDLDRPVPRSAIHHHIFQVRIALENYAPYSPFDIANVIVGRCDDGNCRIS